MTQTAEPLYPPTGVGISGSFFIVAVMREKRLADIVQVRYRIEDALAKTLIRE